MTNRSLAQLAAEQTGRRIYLAHFEPTLLQAADASAQLADELGLGHYPAGAQRDRVRLYRFLGFDRDSLDCDSTTLIAIAKSTIPEQIICRGDQVSSLLIPHGDRIPFVDLTYGNSLLTRDDDDDVFQPLGYRRCIKLWNRTGKDLFFHWTQDVHTDDVWSGLILNNHADTQKSRKTNGNAQFHLDVYKNDNGNIGPRLGDGGSIPIGTICSGSVADNSNLFAEQSSGKVRLYAVTSQQIVITIAQILIGQW